MAWLDVTDIVLDPDFADELVCERLVQKVGNDGIAANVPTEIPIAGVVTNAAGDKLDRSASGERIGSTIIVHTPFVLQTGEGEQENGDNLTADVLQWNRRRFTVIAVGDNSHFGRGFVAATCELIPLSG